MKNTALTLTFLLLSYLSVSQDQVDWNYMYNPRSTQIEITATIANGWHLYSQHIDNEIGPIPTSFQFADNGSVKLIGSTVEPESIKEYDPNFEGELNFFKDAVTFVQKVEVDRPTELTGVVTYMVCNDVMCLPPVDELFKIEVK